MPTYELWMPAPHPEPVASFSVVGKVEADAFEALAASVTLAARELGLRMLPNAVALRLPGVMEGIGVSLLFAVERANQAGGTTVTHILANKLTCKGRTPTHIDLPDPEEN